MLFTDANTSLSIMIMKVVNNQKSSLRLRASAVKSILFFLP